MEDPETDEQQSMISGSVTAHAYEELSLHNYGLDEPEGGLLHDPELARLAELAQEMLAVPFCAISMFVNGAIGTIFGTPGVPIAFNKRAGSLFLRILPAGQGSGTFVVPDAAADSTFSDLSWVNGEVASIRFYAAATLTGREGVPLGAVCAWSEEPLVPSPLQLARLEQVRDVVMKTLDARRATREIQAWSDGPVGGS